MRKRILAVDLKEPVVRINWPWHKKPSVSRPPRSVRKHMKKLIIGLVVVGLLMFFGVLSFNWADKSMTLRTPRVVFVPQRTSAVTQDVQKAVAPYRQVPESARKAAVRQADALDEQARRTALAVEQSGGWRLHPTQLSGDVRALSDLGGPRHNR